MPKVLIADDSWLVRKVITRAIQADPQLTLAGVAENGLQAVEAVRRLQPDALVLDVEMPEMDGIEALVEIRKFDRQLPIVMFSSLTQRGAEATIRALTSGASDYVGKPAQTATPDESYRLLETTLLPKIKALCAARPRKVAPLGPPPSSPGSPSSSTSATPAASSAAVQRSPAPSTAQSSIAQLPASQALQALCIGISTGGPAALLTLFENWRQPLPVPVFIVQHMPPRFTELLARRLSEAGGMQVQEPYDGESPQPGHAYLAPGGWHLELEREGQEVRMRITDHAPENSCRPSADRLFRTAAAVYGPRLLGLVMTGMGDDGLEGSKAIVERGGLVIAQDEDSSTIWGMPGAVVQAGLAEKTVSLNDLASEVMSRVQGL